MDVMAGCPYWVLGFAEDGTLTSPAAGAFVQEVADTGVRDLFVISHGWGTSQAAADDLYASLLPMIVQAAQGVSGLGPVGLAGIHWPSLWFPENPAQAQASAPGGDAQSSLSSIPSRPSSGDAELTGQEIAATLRESFDESGRELIDQLGALVDEGVAAAASGMEPDQVQRERLAEFHSLLQQLVPPSTDPTFEDSGERALLRTDTPESDYAKIAAQFGTAGTEGAAEGIGDIFRTVWNGAKGVLRVASYYVMKARAGQIGRAGLGPLLTSLHQAAPEARVHLIGHSFGARLVSFSLPGIPSAEQSPVASLTLIQAAFSHYAFSHAQDNPFAAEGALRPYADRVHGPLVATYSTHDWAVGRWYPAASALAQQDNQANPSVSRWGGLGADGFQAVTPLASFELLAPGTTYPLAPGTFYGINGSAVICDWHQSSFAGAHSDIRHPEVAWLTVAGALAGASVGDRDDA
jgi:hypothetical protein